MKLKGIWLFLAIWAIILALLGAVVLCFALGVFGQNTPAETTPSTTLAPETTEPSAEPTTVPTTQIPTTAPVETTLPPTEPPTTEPEEMEFYLTFAGDCTLGTMYQYYNASYSFPATVGDRYDYPFAMVQSWFAGDDFTMVNLEGPLTEEGEPAEKRFAFRGDPKYVNILTQGGVECVSLANNHAEDFGAVGYESTVSALSGAGVAYAGDGETCLVETERGLKVGVLAAAFYMDEDAMAQAIGELRSRGAEIVIVSFHWGVEGDYRHGYDQQYYAYTAIDLGADIVFGHHPHVLQEVEEYNGGVIYYSLGNFSFGGNDNPRDYDTAMISQQVIRDVDGSVRLGSWTAIPCSVSGVSHMNDFQPTPMDPGTPEYERVMSKLQGSFTGENLGNPYEETTAPTETTGVTETTAPTVESTEAPTEPAETPDSTG